MSPIFQQPHHICIVVADIAAAIRYYESLGIGPWHDYPPLSEFTAVEMPNEAGFRQLIFKYADLPGLQLQLCEPGPADTPQRRFLETKGPGVFHIGFSVDHLNETEQSGKAAGLQPLMRGRRPDGSGFTYFDTAEEAGVILEIRKAKRISGTSFDHHPVDAEMARTTSDKTIEKFRRPMVPTAEVAQEIYLAILKGRGDKFLPSNTVKVIDEGEHWTVIQFPADPSSALGKRGGGTLSITIAKSNGAIDVHYAR